MNAGALVYCLLDAEGGYTPAGYNLIEKTRVGDYELGLWQGLGHRNKLPIKFNEISLNVVGRSFEPAKQHIKYPGSTSALGRRGDLLRVVADWIRRFGDLYIGSEVPKKLAFYHKLFKHYLPQLRISEPFPAFDESEGVPDYFFVTADRAILDSLQEDVDARRYLAALPSVVDKATAEATKLFTQRVESGSVNKDNFGEMAEDAVTEIVDSLQLTTEDELVDSDLFNTVLQSVLTYDGQHRT
jgi:hypothetical protein